MSTSLPRGRRPSGKAGREAGGHWRRNTPPTVCFNRRVPLLSLYRGVLLRDSMESLQMQQVVRKKSPVHGHCHVRSSIDPQLEFWVQQSCNALDCYECERKKVLRMVGRIHEWVSADAEIGYRLMTFSNTNSPLLRSSLNSLGNSWRRFTDYVRQVPNHPWTKVVRWAKWIEVTEGVFGYNAHYHVITGAKTDLDWESLHRYWNLASGAVSQLNIGELSEGGAIARYAASYAKKEAGVFWGGLSRRTMTRYGCAFKGRQRISWSKGTAPQRSVGRFYYCCPASNDSECQGDGT